MSAASAIDEVQRSVQNQPSETAMATATMRALAVHDEREEIRGPDTLAEIFLPEDRKTPLRDPAARQWVMKNKIAPGAYEFMIARTAFFDHLVRDALEQKLPQLVLLGAGYDSRPYRFRDLAAHTRVFELDSAPTQKHKQEVLEKAAITMPEHLVFVPVDFNQDDLGEVLLGASFSMEQKTLFLWEGITYYLPSGTVDDTLATIRAISSAGSSIGFDYASISQEALSEEGIRKLRELMKFDHPAEPAKFGIPRGKLDPFLGERGYRILKNLGPAEMEAKYLTLRDGSIIGKVPALFSLVHAAVKTKEL